MKKIIVSIVLALLLAGCAAIKIRMLERAGETVTVGTYQVEMTIDRTPDEVFDHLANWNDLQMFMPYADLEIPSDPVMTKEGQYIDGIAHILGMNVPVRYVIIEFDPGRAQTMALAGKARGWMRLTMDPAGDQTLFRGNLHLFSVVDSPGGL